MATAKNVKTPVPEPSPVAGDPSKKKPIVGYYRLLRGTHACTDPDGKKQVYKQGAVFPSVSDLLRHNHRGMQPKFAKVEKGEASVAATSRPGGDPGLRETYEAMSLEELQVVAMDEEIEVAESDDKAAVINKLLGVA